MAPPLRRLAPLVLAAALLIPFSAAQGAIAVSDSCTDCAAVPDTCCEHVPTI